MRSSTKNQTKGGLARLPCEEPDAHSDQMACPLSLFGKQEEGDLLIFSGGCSMMGKAGHFSGGWCTCLKKEKCLCLANKGIVLGDVRGL